MAYIHFWLSGKSSGGSGSFVGVASKRARAEDDQLEVNGGGAGSDGSSSVHHSEMYELIALQARLSLRSARDIADLREIC